MLGLDVSSLEKKVSEEVLRLEQEQKDIQLNFNKKRDQVILRIEDVLEKAGIKEEIDDLNAALMVAQSKAQDRVSKLGVKIKQLQAGSSILQQLGVVEAIREGFVQVVVPLKQGKGNGFGELEVVEKS